MRIGMKGQRKISFMNKQLIIIFFAFSGFNLQGQSIIGKVLDSKTLEALPFANVFLNNTTIGTTTDTNGDFRLNSIKEPGTFEIVFSFVGYESYKTKVNVGDGILNMGTIRLKPSEIELNTVEVQGTRDKEWEKKLKKFKKIFLGEDKLSASSTILNPWVIDFPPDNNGKFIAKAIAPIEIQNDGLGYKIIFYLSNFWSDGTGYSIIGNARFTELKSVDASELLKWQENRKKSYQHSTHHLFKSIIENRIYGEGFKLYTETDAYKNAFTRSSEFYSELGKTVISYDTIGLAVPDKEKGFYRINLKGRVEVHYRKEKALVRVYRDVYGPVSWIRLSKDYVIVNEDGFAKNPTEVVVSGDMSSVRVAGMLPLDYKPMLVTDDAVNEINFSMYQEQMYVHTDKPYYYPGETIWFKGYVNYATPAWRDSLSRTVYVELVDRETKTVVRSKTLKIASGVFDNNFRLSDTLAAKMYYIRAYTNFNRNFGDEDLYIKPLPVLNITDKVNYNTQVKYETSEEGFLTISTDKKSYKPREKITLSLKLMDDNNEAVSGNLSVTVVDSMQVAPVKISGTILEDYPLKEIPDNRINKELPFQVEYGINFSGRFLNESDKPEKAMLNILQLNPNYFLMAQSDEEGIFKVSGLSFYDTAIFSVQSSRGKGNAYGLGEWVKSTPASIDFKELDNQVEIIKTDLTQRILSEFEAPKGTRVLQEVVVKSTKIEEEYKGEYRVKRSYGKPDHVIKRSDLNLNYGNLLLALPGKVPGLTVRQSYSEGQGMRWVVYVERGKNNSISNGKEVIVTVNDVLMSGTPEEILSNIDPAIVETIEVKKGINVLYGSLGGSGVVSIYTKKDYQQNESTKSMSMMKVPGYSRAREFSAPDYSDPQTDTTQADYRSTIYWNPEVITDDKTGLASVSFFATDLPGKYRIEVEGVNQNGEPVRGSYFINIENK